MKVLQVNCVIKEGSTGKITYDIHQYLLHNREESVVICGRRAPKDDDTVYGVVSELRGKINHLVSNISGVMYGGCFLSTEKIKRIVQKENPDIVHLQCINGNFCNIFRILEFLKKRGVPTVLTLHAEFMYTSNCSYAGDCEQWKNGCKKCAANKTACHSLFFDRTSYSWNRMHNIYKDWDNLHVVACSKWIADRAGQSGEMAHRDIRVIYNGIDNNTIFYPHPNAREQIIEKYNLPKDKNIVVYVSPGLSARKGFDMFLDLVHKCQNDQLHFLVVGGEYDGDESNITVIGKVTDRDLLAQLYSASDAFVICSRNDNYPTVCLEANSCGTKIVGFDVGGVSETICENMGAVVPFGDVSAMREKLLEVVKNTTSEQTIENARKQHSKERMLQQYMDLYQSLYKNNEAQ